MINEKIQLDFTEEGLREKIEVVQGDTGRVLVCNVIGVDMTNVSARFYAIKKSGKEIYNNCLVAGNKVTIDLTEQTLAETGIVKCQLDLRKGSQKVQSFIFNITVTESLMAQSEYLSSNEYRVIDNLAGEVEDNKNKIAELDDKKANKDDYGSPLTASTVSAMTDKKKVYVYTGSESGYTAGNWYSWNGTAWVPGGVYNSAAIQTDKTLTQSDKAADSAIVGQQIGELKESKINSDQGKNNKGKYLSVGKDGNIALSDPPSNGGEVKDANGNKYLIYVKDDGTLGAKKVKELFSGKQIVSRTDLTKYETTTSGNRYCFKDMITGESTYSGPSGWYPLKSFDNEGQSSTFKTTEAYETLLANTSGEYSFITNFLNDDLGQLNGAYPFRGDWKSNIQFQTQGADPDIYITIDSMPYLGNDGKLKTFSVDKHVTSTKVKNTFGGQNGWATKLQTVVLTKDGKVKIYYNGTFIEEHSAPSDFIKWDFSFYATQTSASAGIIATSRLISDNAREYIILNNAVTEKDLISYYNYYAGSNTTLSTQDSICMQVGDNVSLYYGVVPEVSKNLVTLSTDDTNTILLKDNVVTALKEGTATITVSVNNASKDITIYVGKEVTDEDRETIETLSTRDINQIVIVNAGDIPSTIAVDDEYAIYALGIDTTQDIPYQYSDQNMFKFSSSNNSICDVTFGVLHAKKKGTATITISSIDETVKKTFNIQVVDKDNELAEYDIYKCDDRKHEIYNNGTNATRTTKGLKEAMDYAVEQGYKGIRFNSGNYSIDPNSCPIVIPSNLEVDFNGGEIHAPNVNPSKTYPMFSCDSVENVKFKNARVYGENYYGSHFHSEGTLSFNISNACKNIKVEDCEFSYGPGFNVSMGYKLQGAVAVFKLANVEQGSLTDNGEIKDDNITSHFRSKDYIDLTRLELDEFGLGNMQGYQGYTYMTSRLYNIYFYDENKSFISVLKWCVQYQTYKKPSNAKYCKVMFFQQSIPTSSDPDYQGIAWIYCIKNPENIYITRCTMKQNVSTGLSPQGGKHLVVTDCIFDTNGHSDPNAQIDWEDGRMHMQGHIIRRCKFLNESNYACQIVSSASRDVTFHDNYVQNSMYYKFGTEALNTRTYRNFFTGTKIDYTNKGDCVFIGNTYTQEPTFGTPQGGTLMKYNNKLLDN